MASSPARTVVKLHCPREPHLVYSTNIHAGETWDAILRNLDTYVVAVKSRVAPRERFGVGLRLSAAAASTLGEPRNLEEFKAFLVERGLYVFTINGFPYGTFHGTRVKERVYRPDWLEEPRLEYSDALAFLLAELLPVDDDLEGSISTVPCAFHARVTGESDVRRMADLMIRHVATLHRIRERTGARIGLALEPEPGCHLETTDDAIRFFGRFLFCREAVSRLSALTGLGASRSELMLREHIGVCFDACHMAVQYEEAADAFAALHAAGIRIIKIQLSAGLKVHLTGQDAGLIGDLSAFDEGIYLHQVMERRDGSFTRYPDLPEALDSLATTGDGLREWRIHFHVPLFLDRLGRFRGTQDHIARLLELVRRDSPTRHLEIETYTWGVMPEVYREEGVVSALAREFTWVVERIGS